MINKKKRHPKALLKGMKSTVYYYNYRLRKQFKGRIYILKNEDHRPNQLQVRK